jgi:glycosyltransferase involved in cell wall biosynthesis
MPSVWQEALGLVVVEAMASGLAVVASRSGGIPELLEGGGGVLVERGSVGELADALQRLAGDVVLRQGLAAEAYASFQASFTWDVVRRNYGRIVSAVREAEPVAHERPGMRSRAATRMVGRRDVPEVSVIIPTRGRPELLSRAIRSVLAQTMQRFEMVVVLDGEDAATAGVVERFADERITLVALEESVGGAEARNVGVLHARGKYVALLDDDDEWMPGKLQAQVDAAEGHARKNVVVVTRYVYRLEGQPDEVWPAQLPKGGEPLSEFLFSSRGGFQTSTYFCSRELFLRVPFAGGLKKHQDWDWFLQLTALPEFALLVVPEPLSIYWVPEPSRVSISGRLDWEFSYRWARSRRSLMTRKAYSRFLVKICLRSAMAQEAGGRAVLRLLRDVIARGLPTPLLMAEFVVGAVVSEGLRLRLRPMVQRLRRPHPRAAG